MENQFFGRYYTWLIIGISLNACSSFTPGTSNIPIDSPQSEQVIQQPDKTPNTQPSPAFTESAEYKAKIDKIRADLKQAEQKYQEETHKNKIESHKDRACIYESDAGRSEESLSADCKKRLADLEKNRGW
jgi:hypothetical protein